MVSLPRRARQPAKNSGASSSFEETLNTLKYANRAKNIKTNATRNSLDVNHHISEYVNLIGSLRTEITRLKHQLVRGGRCGGGPSGDGVSATRSEVHTSIGTFRLHSALQCRIRCVGGPLLMLSRVPRIGMYVAGSTAGG